MGFFIDYTLCSRYNTFLLKQWKNAQMKDIKDITLDYLQQNYIQLTKQIEIGGIRSEWNGDTDPTQYSTNESIDYDEFLLELYVLIQKYINRNLSALELIAIKPNLITKIDVDTETIYGYYGDYAEYETYTLIVEDVYNVLKDFPTQYNIT